MTTMANIRANAERLAWTDEVVNRESARYSPDLSRSDRAALLLTARRMKRSAIRISQYLNKRTCLCGGWTVAGRVNGVPYRYCARSGAHVWTQTLSSPLHCPYARRQIAIKA